MLLPEPLIALRRCKNGRIHVAPLHEMNAVSEATQKRLENRRWLLRIVLAVAMAGASSAALSLMGFKGKPVLIGGGWVTNDFSDPSGVQITR